MELWFQVQWVECKVAILFGGPLQSENMGPPFKKLRNYNWAVNHEQVTSECGDTGGTAHRWDTKEA